MGLGGSSEKVCDGVGNSVGVGGLRDSMEAGNGGWGHTAVSRWRRRGTWGIGWGFPSSSSSLHPIFWSAPSFTMCLLPSHLPHLPNAHLPSSTHQLVQLLSNFHQGVMDLQAAGRLLPPRCALLLPARRLRPPLAALGGASLAAGRRWGRRDGDVDAHGVTEPRPRQRLHGFGLCGGEQA